MIEEKYQEHIKTLESIVSIIEKMGLRIVEMRDRHVKLTMPLEPNTNHLGIMYAGSIFSAGECMMGPLFVASFDYKRFYPIVKSVNIQFLRPVKTDVTVEATLSEAEVDAIQREAWERGKAALKMDLEVKDREGEVCSLLQGVWQLRKYENL